MKRGLDWVEVSRGRSVLTYREVAITFRSIWLRLGEPMRLGTSDFLIPRVLFVIDPGVGGGSPMMSFVFSFVTSLAALGFSVWLPLGSFSRSEKRCNHPLQTHSCSGSSWRP